MEIQGEIATGTFVSTLPVTSGKVLAPVASTDSQECFTYKARNQHGLVKVQMSYVDAPALKLTSDDADLALEASLQGLRQQYPATTGRVVSILELEDQNVPIYAITGLEKDRVLTSLTVADGGRMLISMEQEGAYERDDLGKYMADVVLSMGVHTKKMGFIPLWDNSQHIPASMIGKYGDEYSEEFLPMITHSQMSGQQTPSAAAPGSTKPPGAQGSPAVW